MTKSDIVYPNGLPFISVHLLCLGAIWTGIAVPDLILCAALYYGRLFAVTAGYHRYFSHRSFKTSRLGQFLLGWWAQTSLQQGVLWWARWHRHHHAHSDRPDDVHSPRHHGMWYAHLGWIFDRNHDPDDEDLRRVNDLSRYPELVWLNRNQYLPGILLGLAVWLAFGWSGLIVGFAWSTVLCWHGTFTINSLSHGFGSERYYTGDDSRNNWLLATFVTLGEGWHNNHHHFPVSTRQGFRKWELDFTYYALKGLSWTGLVWQLNEPPARALSETRQASRYQIERAATELAESHRLPPRSAERACCLLLRTASEGSEPLASRARKALANAAGSMSPYQHRALEAWLQLVEHARERVWDACKSQDACVHRAFAVLSEAANEAITPIRCRAREALASLATSIHPMAENASQTLAELSAHGPQMPIPPKSLASYAFARR